MKIPEAGVPEIMTMEGKFVRAAYNNEGYVILGYQLANRSIGEGWMLLEVGITVRDSVPDYRLRRDALSLETPDGKTIPLPSVEEHRKADTRAMQQREQVQRDSINYFPPSANRACAMTFFPDLTSRAMPQDDVELSSNRACLGRLYFADTRRDRVRAALAQREVREERRSSALPNPDQGGRAVPVEELQGHREAGEGRVQEEVRVRHC